MDINIQRAPTTTEMVWNKKLNVTDLTLFILINIIPVFPLYFTSELQRKVKNVAINECTAIVEVTRLPISFLKRSFNGSGDVVCFNA